jgi:hypothetical protein
LGWPQAAPIFYVILKPAAALSEVEWVGEPKNYRNHILQNGLQSLAESLDATLSLLVIPSGAIDRYQDADTTKQAPS